MRCHHEEDQEDPQARPWKMRRHLGLVRLRGGGPDPATPPPKRRQSSLLALGFGVSPGQAQTPQGSPPSGSAAQWSPPRRSAAQGSPPSGSAAQGSPPPVAYTPQQRDQESATYTPQQRDQESARRNVLQEVAQDRAREQARATKTAARQLFLDPAALGKGYHSGGRPKRPLDQRRGVAGGHKSNVRKPGEASLRREVPIVGRIIQIQAVLAAAKKQECKPSELSPDTWRSLCGRFGETRKTLLNLLPRLEEFVQYLHKSRLERGLLRPFGGQAKVNQACRVRGVKTEKQQPLQPVFQNLKAWFNHERAWGVEVRPSHLRLRFKLHLERAVAYQEVLKEKGKSEHKPKLLESAKQRLEKYQDPNWVQRDQATWERRFLWPSVGASFRWGDRKSSTSSTKEDLLVKTTWASLDYAVHLATQGDHEDLGILVADPQAFQANLRDTAVVMFDHSPVWVRYSGKEEGCLFNLQERHSYLERKRLSKATRSTDLEAAAEAHKEMAQHLEATKHLGSQAVRHLAPGADKYRLTWIDFQVVTGWFDAGAQPKGSLLPCVLLVPSDTHCRLEDIDQEGNWTRDHEFQVGDEVVKRRRGESAGAILRTWRALRDRSPDPTWTKKFRVWGQPCAWADAVIAQWTLEYIKDHYNQAVLVADCLLAHWNSNSLAVAWANQLLQVPIAPGATGLLQVADTHYHSPFKAVVWRPEKFPPTPCSKTPVSICSAPSPPPPAPKRRSNNWPG